MTIYPYQNFTPALNQHDTRIENTTLQSESENINLEAERLNESISWDEFKGDFV
jgi:hypothetical protein